MNRKMLIAFEILAIGYLSSRVGDAATIRRISTGADDVQSRGTTDNLQASRDGRYVVFSNDGNNMVEKLKDGTHYYWKDLQTGQLALIDPPTAGRLDREPVAIRLSADGHNVAMLQRDPDAN